MEHILLLVIIYTLGIVVVIQRAQINDYKLYNKHWYTAYQDTLFWYGVAYRRLYSNVNRKKEKLYRNYLKRKYKYSKPGPFSRDYRTRAMHSIGIDFPPAERNIARHKRLHENRMRLIRLAHYYQPIP